MENLSTELGAEAMALVGVIAVVVQQFKGMKAVEDIKAKVPNIINFISMGLGIGAAYLLSMPNPIIAGIMMGLMASGAYSTTRKASSG